MFLFTEGQMQRMIKTIEQYRSSLLTSNAACINVNSDKPLNCLIFPNPTSGNVKIEWDLEQNTEGGKIQLFNALGQQLFMQLIPAQTGFAPLDKHHFSNGVYLLSITLSNKDVSFQKIVLAK